MLCIEEPENGIHPSRVPNLAELLRDYAVDANDAVGADNPLRQVVLNSHSPEVARQFSPDDLLFVERALTSGDGPISVFRPIEGTWRTTLSNGTESRVLPADRQAVADFIGGSRQLRIRTVGSGVWIGAVNRQLAYAVVADGGTDRLLVPIIQWAVHRLDQPARELVGLSQISGSACRLLPVPERLMSSPEVN